MLAITLVLAVPPAFACSCAGPAKYTCEVPAADVIVLAKVVSIEHNVAAFWLSVQVTLDVAERFRGETSDRLVIRTAHGEDACGYAFERGLDYLVFASEHEGKLVVTYCSATQPAKAATSRIRQLRAARTGPALASLFGSVATPPLHVGEDREKYVQPVAGLTVVAQSGGKEYRTTTADDGLYEFQGLARGEYRVHVEAPAGRAALWSGGVESVRTGVGWEKSCPVDFQIFWDGLLAGTVVNRHNEPVSSGWVYAQREDFEKSHIPPLQYPVKDGRFEIPKLSPGRYRLEFRADGSPPGTYYPGTKDQSKAAWIELGEGTHIDNLQIVIAQ